MKFSVGVHSGRGTNARKGSRSLSPNPSWRKEIRAGDSSARKPRFDCVSSRRVQNTKRALRQSIAPPMRGLSPLHWDRRLQLGTWGPE